MLKKTIIALALAFALTLLMVSSVAITAYAADEQKTQGAMTLSPALQGVKNATPMGPALLPDLSKVVERQPVKTEPKHNPAGSQMLVAKLTMPVTCDGSIDATEWSDAYMYDVSDTTGQEDGIPDPLGTVTLWLKQDDNGVYFAIRNNVDQTLDEYDQCGLYFDDNYDGCFPASATNEGNNWLVWSATGSFVQWRWIQDFDCGFPPNYVCTGDNYGGNYWWTPTCFGIGIGPTGNVDYEVMIPYGVIDEYLDLTMPPDTLGFFMYCLDNGPYVFNGEWPSQYYSSTYNEPCYYGRLICEGEQEWPNHKMHFPQLPDLEGWDVLATFPKTLADDWQCSATGPVTDIHFWGSWKDIDGDPTTDDYYTPMPLFQLSIHRNIPADADTPWSRPGEQVWGWEGEIPGTPFEPPAMEHWFNPNTGEYFCNDHVPYWRYDLVDIPAPFIQKKDSIYWLNVSAVGIPLPYQWGWKSSRDHFMDDAVYTDNAPAGPWQPMVEPPRCNWFNVYFDSQGFPTDSGSTNYYGQGWYGYEYWWNMWFYDNPFVSNPKHIWLQFNINPIGPAPSALFAINWSTPAWDELGMGRPPLPGDDEMLYIGRQEFPVLIGPNTIDFSLPYNPEWVSIDFVATNVVINGWIWHECIGTSLDLAFVITGKEVPPGRNHYKTWWIEPQSIPPTTVFVKDQFMEDSLTLTGLEYLSNPVEKVVQNETFNIVSPNDHLTWYRAVGRDTLIRVGYVNQFDSVTYDIGPVEWLLVPTQKEPHDPPVGLDHYKCYRIIDPQPYDINFTLQDQFDPIPEEIMSISPMYFCTPCQKNHEPMFDTITHYVAYQIVPPNISSESRLTWDQFGEHFVQVLNSEMLLVPSKKWIPQPCDPPNIGCPADETQNQNGVYTTTTQWTADDGNPADPTINLTSVTVDLAMLPPGISAASVNIDPPGLPAKTASGTVTYTVSDHCQAGGPITLIATNNCPTPNNTATCTFNVTLTNAPPAITQPDSINGFVNSTVQYDISGNDPNGDVINDAASILIEPSCGTYSITRTSGSGTSSGTWQVSWQTGGCSAGTYLVIHDLTDICQATSYCTTKVHLSEETGWYWKPGYPDYAPNGMPDIDQKQDMWIKYDTDQWSLCGPVAVANCFKWFDSKYNVPPGAPCDGIDMFPLVRDYTDQLAPIWCPNPWDDHSPENVDHPATSWNPGIGPPPPTPQPFVPGPQPPGLLPPWGELVERLAWYFNTDGIQTGYCEFTGTKINQMQQGIDQWLSSEKVNNVLYERTWSRPTFTWVETLVEKSQDVILLLGFWFEDPPASGEWFRIGGHYVTVAGVNSEQGMIAFSDPFVDAAEMGFPGIVGDGYIIPHPHGSHDPTVHNDEGNVSHDIYVIYDSPSPGGVWGLPEYAIYMDPYYWAWNFFNQNVPDEFVPLTAPWNEISPIFTEVEYAVEISPWEYPPDCGDMNCDGIINVTDILWLINYKFLTPPGPPPCNLVKADVNHDGAINVQDIIYLINYKFLVPPGPPPQCYDP
jgi:hypothetical protein